MPPSSLVTHTIRTLLGAACIVVAVTLLDLGAGRLPATLLAGAGALLLFLANPNAVPLVNKAIRARRLPKAAPLAKNDLAMIHYDVRHAPRPGRHP